MSDEVAIVACRGLVKTFREGELGVPVLRGIDLTVVKGERVAIIGTSGAGKSTLLHLLGGLDVPTEGEVEIAGEQMSRLSETARGQLRNRSLGFIYQFHHLLAEFTALENVAMPLLVGGNTVENASAQARMLLEEVGLGERLAHKPGELSGGERQRAAVARALVNRPACVLADEPTANLDLNTGTEIIELLRTMNQNSGVTVISATHDHKMLSVSDRVVWISDGQVDRIALREDLEIETVSVGDEEH